MYSKSQSTHARQWRERHADVSCLEIAEAGETQVVVEPIGRPVKKPLPAWPYLVLATGCAVALVVFWVTKH